MAEKKRKKSTNRSSMNWVEQVNKLADGKDEDKDDDEGTKSYNNTLLEAEQKRSRKKKGSKKTSKTRGGEKENE